MKVPYKEVKVINENEFSKFISEHYGRPYSYQQQDGCKEGGIEYWKVPIHKWELDGFFNDSINEELNGWDRGVSFEAWLKRDPKAPVGEFIDEHFIRIFWHRSFYPHITSILYNLYKRGFIEEGEYMVIIGE